MSRYQAMFVLLGLLVFVLGVLSRTIDLQSPIFNKYLGDALYAVLFYLVLGALRPRSTIARRTLITIAFVVLVECFQLTLIPLKMRQAGGLPSVLSILLGTKFSWYDMFAYFIGITTISQLDLRILSKRSGDASER